MFKNALFATSVCLLLLLGGCSAIPTVALSEYPEDKTSTMEQIPNLPSPEILSNTERTKVIVLQSDDAGIRNARQIQLGETLTRDLDALLGANGIETIDRNMAAKLDQEIKMCELQSKKCGSSSGPSVAKYAIKATITGADYNSVYVAETRWTDKDGRTYVNPAHFKHTASTGVSIKVYELPSLREVKAVIGTDTDNKQTAMNENLGASMVRASLKDSISTGQAKADLLNVFAPKGYIIGKRTPKDGKGKPIFKVSIGSSNGLVAGAPILVVTEQQTTNPITKKTSTELIDVAKLKTSNLVYPDEAWALADDSETAGRVRLGDQALVQHAKGSFMDSFAHELKKAVGN